MKWNQQIYKKMVCPSSYGSMEDQIRLASLTLKTLRSALWPLGCSLVNTLTSRAVKAARRSWNDERVLLQPEVRHGKAEGEDDQTKKPLGTLNHFVHHKNWQKTSKSQVQQKDFQSRKKSLKPHGDQGLDTEFSANVMGPIEFYIETHRLHNHHETKVCAMRRLAPNISSTE